MKQTTAATIIVTLLITMMVVMSMGCQKEQVVYPETCEQTTFLGTPTNRNERSSTTEGVATFMHEGAHQFQRHDGFTWKPLHNGWITGCVSVSLALLTPRTHCDNQYSALRILRKPGHSYTEGRRWFVDGVEIYENLGIGCVSVYVFDQEGSPVKSNCNL